MENKQMYLLSQKYSELEELENLYKKKYSFTIFLKMYCKIIAWLFSLAFFAFGSIELLKWFNRMGYAYPEYRLYFVSGGFIYVASFILILGFYLTISDEKSELKEKIKEKTNEISNIEQKLGNGE